MARKQRTPPPAIITHRYQAPGTGRSRVDAQVAALEILLEGLERQEAQQAPDPDAARVAA